MLREAVSIGIGVSAADKLSLSASSQIQRNVRRKLGMAEPDCSTLSVLSAIQHHPEFQLLSTLTSLYCSLFLGRSSGRFPKGFPSHCSKSHFVTTATNIASDSLPTI
jgi:hypothetical protein